MKRWIELVDDYAQQIKHMARRKIRLQDGSEIWALWDSREGCFFWDGGENSAYLDEPDKRPSHIQAG